MYFFISNRVRMPAFLALLIPISNDTLQVHCCCLCLVAKSCLTLSHPMEYSPSGSSVYRMSQAKILEWVVISFSRGVSRVSCLADQFFTTDTPVKSSQYIAFCRSPTYRDLLWSCLLVTPNAKQADAANFLVLFWQSLLIHKLQS